MSATIRNAIALWLGALWRLRRGVAPALLAIAVAELVGVGVLSPLGAGAVNWLIRRTGRHAIANDDLVAFFLSPLGLLVGAVAFTVTVGVTGLGRAAALVAMLRAESGARVSGVACVARALKRTVAIFELAARQVLGAGVMLLPFGVVIGAIAWVALRGVDLYWMVTVRPARFWIALACIAPVALAGAWFVGRRVLAWSVSLPLCVLCGRSPRAALHESDAALKNQIGAVALARLGWLALNGAVAVGALLLVSAAAERVLAREWGGLTTTAVVAALALLAHGAVAFVMTLVGTLGDTAVVYSAWRRFAGGVEADAQAAGDAPRTPGSWRRLRFKAIGAVAAIAVAGALAAAGLIEAGARPVNIEITAHRGAALAAPENTLAAIRAAAEQGADRVEIDAMLTADGAAVVFHDTDLRRIGASPRRVADMTLEEMRAIDAGSWFGPAFAGERVPTLEEAVELAGALGVKLNVEMKAAGGDEEALAERVVGALRDRAGGRGAVITSLSPRALEAVRRADPTARIGLIVTASVGDLRREDVDFLSVESGIATRAFLRRAERAGLPVHVWGVHDTDLFTRLALDRVEGVIAPDPGAMRARRDELRALTEGERLLLAFRARVVGR